MPLVEDKLPVLLGSATSQDLSSKDGGSRDSPGVVTPGQLDSTSSAELDVASQENSTRPDSKCSLCAKCCGVDFPPLAQLLTEVVSGVTVALAMVPEAVAFSVATQVKPQVGIITSFMICLLTTILGGRPAMVSGATGSISALTGALVAQHGPEYLFYAVMLMGVIQIIAGFLGIGNLVRLVPASVEIGFANGLALVIFFFQFSSYKIPGMKLHEAEHVPENFKALAEGGFEEGLPAALAVIISLITFAISVGLPFLTKRVPSALTGIIVGTAFEWAIVRAACKTNTTLVSDLGSAGGSLPIPVWLDSEYNMPAPSLEVLSKVFPLAIMMSVVGILESAVTQSLINERTKTKSNVMREVVGQGMANLVCGVFGGMGGCAMLGQSMINITSGARGRLSTFCTALFLLVILLAIYPAINIIPMASLAGVMFNVVYQTFEWSSLKLLIVSALPKRFREHLREDGSRFKKIRRVDAFIIAVVTAVTLWKDLAVAVGVGFLFACLMHIYEADQMISVSSHMQTDAEGTAEMKVYTVQGVLFFGSVAKFLDFFDVENDPQQVRIIFDSGYISDFSALEGLNKLGERYGESGKKISLQLLHPGCSKIVEKAANLLVKELSLAPEDEQVLDQHRFRHRVEGYDQSFGGISSELPHAAPETRPTEVLRRRSAMLLPVTVQ